MCSEQPVQLYKVACAPGGTGKTVELPPNSFCWAEIKRWPHILSGPCGRATLSLLDIASRTLTVLVGIQSVKHSWGFQDRELSTGNCSQRYRKSGGRERAEVKLAHDRQLQEVATTSGLEERSGKQCQPAPRVWCHCWGWEQAIEQEAGLRLLALCCHHCCRPGHRPRPCWPSSTIAGTSVGRDAEAGRMASRFLLPPTFLPVLSGTSPEPAS